MARIAVALGLLLMGLVPAFSGVATGQEKLSDLEARMNEIQDDLNAATQDLEDLHAEEEEIVSRVQQLEERQKYLEKQKTEMMDQVVEAATILYKNGNTSTIEALFGAESFGELSNGIELLSKVSEHDNGAFIRFSRLQEELSAVAADLGHQKEQLAEAEEAMAAQADVLQSRRDAVGAEWEELHAELEAQLEAQEQPIAPAPSGPSSPAPTFHGDLACPVSGAVSFIDSWGYPRSGGRTHEGVDIMANYGQPTVAIVSGTITFAGYGDTAGNWMSLSGDDGNVYWYMHHQRNIVTSGRVQIGQQIAEVGDTGNAAGTPHLHFEYHPGGGSAVNPYPIAAAACF